MFKLILLKEARMFLAELPPQAAKKIIYNADIVAGGKKDSELFCKLGDTKIWELRTLYGGIIYRLFAFWDTEEETLVVATHGIVKKTQKTPPKEIAKAEETRCRYFEAKKKK